MPNPIHQLQNETDAQKIRNRHSEPYTKQENPLKSIEVEIIKKDGSTGNYEISVSLMKTPRKAGWVPNHFPRHTITERPR